jgi:hypothetical protein
VENKDDVHLILCNCLLFCPATPGQVGIVHKAIITKTLVHATETLCLLKLKMKGYQYCPHQTILCTHENWCLEVYTVAAAQL